MFRVKARDKKITHTSSCDIISPGKITQLMNTTDLVLKFLLHLDISFFNTKIFETVFEPELSFNCNIFVGSGLGPDQLKVKP